MNEVERAISLIKLKLDEVMRCDCPKCIEDRWAFELALQALSEKAEREKGCDICEEDNCAICQNLGVSTFCEDGELCRYFRKSNYCHWCGRKLRMDKPPIARP